jgi:DNA-binding XRE family transcriptional regulator
MALKESRIKMGFTQEQLARLLNISLRTYQNIEKRNDTTVRIAKNLAVLLGETIEEIFSEKE